jgi:hypothetical protein
LRSGGGRGGEERGGEEEEEKECIRIILFGGAIRNKTEPPQTAFKGRLPIVSMLAFYEEGERGTREGSVGGKGEGRRKERKIQGAVTNRKHVAFYEEDERERGREMLGRKEREGERRNKRGKCVGRKGEERRKERKIQGVVGKGRGRTYSGKFQNGLRSSYFGFLVIRPDLKNIIRELNHGKSVHGRNFPKLDVYSKPKKINLPEFFEITFKKKDHSVFLK